MRVGAKIRALRKERKMTISELATQVDSDVGNISRLERDIQGFSPQLLSKIAEALSVPVAELFSDQQPAQHQNMELATPDIHRIPVITYVQAGVWTETSEIRECDGNMAYITTDLDLGQRAFAIVIRGNSMEPEFTEGDLVLIDPDEPLHPGDFVVAKNGEEEATFKKYRPRGYGEDGQEIFELAPLNDDYPTMRSDRQHIQIIGTMVEHRRRRKKR
ncbi:LexA family protein [Aeromonas hydrophila]|uniref:LexA family protein n=1 Tax=Aeromonas hydrophila TaxID=644 RepID=UPI00191DC328|nr:XRE family transcriptional regulator [Aeromonas hydrophila]MBL0572200.1 helix-turn-helix transcriptional regulator [Aeromonas hydrophila]